MITEQEYKNIAFDANVFNEPKTIPMRAVKEWSRTYMKRHISWYNRTARTWCRWFIAPVQWIAKKAVKHNKILIWTILALVIVGFNYELVAVWLG